MALWLWLTIALVALVVMALGLMTAAHRAGAGVDPTQLTFSAELMAEVETLVRTHHRMAGIALLRERTPGLSVLHARNMVDRIAARGQAADRAAEEADRAAQAADQAGEAADRAAQAAGQAAEAPQLARPADQGLTEAAPAPAPPFEQPAEPAESVPAARPTIGLPEQPRWPDHDRLPSTSDVPLEVELQVRGLLAHDEHTAALTALRQATGWESDRAGQYLSALS